MDERVWEKTAQFLKELRCEDTGRLSQLQLPEYQKAVKEMNSHFSQLFGFCYACLLKFSKEFQTFI